MLFKYEELTHLNATEMSVYHYITQNIDAIKKMDIRTLAEETHVSTATIVRFCQKFDCSGFVEFKTKLKIIDEKLKYTPITDEIDALLEFFKYTRTFDFKDKISDFVKYVMQSDMIVFIGIGTSGALAKFGARYFSNVGYVSFYIDDPYYPVSVDEKSHCLLIALSESGETREIIDQIKKYQRKRTKIVSITNKRNSTLSQMSDLSVNYYVKDIILPQTYNISSQAPVIYIIEQVTNELYKQRKQSL